jgi:hypothetical protein
MYSYRTLTCLVMVELVLHTHFFKVQYLFRSMHEYYSFESFRQKKCQQSETFYFPSFSACILLNVHLDLVLLIPEVEHDDDC